MSIKTYEIKYRPFNLGGPLRTRRVNAPDERQARRRARFELAKIDIPKIEIKSCYFVCFTPESFVP